MKKLLLTALLTSLSSLMADENKPAATDTRCFEMRVYYSPEGRLDDLHARFREHTTKLFEKHGMTNIGYWTPVDNKENKLVYVLAYPSREAREKSWKEFMGDPEWKAVQKKTEARGPIVKKVEVLYFQATDYSPKIEPTVKSPRVFELRRYTTTPNNLAALNGRFREHTCKLFEKHGMTNLFYWTLAPDQKEAENTLVYLLAHKDQEAAKASFEAFRKDPDWEAARKASEEKADGSLTVPNGVKSEFLVATDYSPTK